MSYREEICRLVCAGIAQWHLCSKAAASEIATRADARIAELERSVTIRDTEIARLEADLELARRDAARYRWLRRKVCVVGLHHLHDNDCGQFEFANLPRISGPMAGVGSSAEALDVVIDAALLEIKP